MDPYREANRALWNAWTRINLASEFYDVEAFVAGRGRDLDSIARPRLPLGRGSLPLMFSLKATAPA